MADTDEPGELIGHGRACDVYDIGDGRVLRRTRSGTTAAREAAVMAHVRAHGFPVPEVHDHDGADLVMDRIDGPTMLDAMGRQPWRLRHWSETLADLHRRLALVPLPALDLPDDFGGREILVHADLHPDNVMLTESGPVVIDWPNARFGARGAEVASTWVLVATSEIPVDTPGGKVAGAAAKLGRGLFVRDFLRRAGRDAARELLPVVGRHRLADRNLLPGEAENVRRLLAEECGDTDA